MDNTTVLIKIGGLYACIAGDHRYGTTLTVTANPNTREVTVEVSENGAIGGMDGPGGSTPYASRLRQQLVDPTPKQLVDAVRDAISYEDRGGAGVLANYGKPSKNFIWYRGHDRVLGLSQAKARFALEGVFG